MSNTIGRRAGPGLLTPGAMLPKRSGFGLARGNAGSSWGNGSPIDREDVTESGLASFQQQPTNRQQAALSRRAYAKVQWAYRGHHAYASCVDFITGCALTNGEDPARRVWRMVPVRDQNDEPIKNPDERQLEPVFRFLNDCHPTLKFDQLLKPMMTDFVAANALNAEIALSRFLLNPDGEPQPGALYTLPQIEIFPIVDERGELNQATPFVQIRPGQKPTTFTWPQSLWMTDGYMGGTSVNPMTPVDSILTPVHTMIEAQKYIDSFFTSGAKMGTVFKGGESWTADDALEFLLYIEQNYLRSENGHKPYVLFGDVDLRDLPQNAHEFAQYIEIMRAMANAICSRFPLDPRLISAESQGSALGNKGERQHVWTEALNGPVNRKKKAFGAAFTDRVIHKGFGATDWAMELVPFTTDDDAERMSQMASALKTANESGFVSWEFPSDLNNARKMFDPEFKELDEQEVLEFFGPAPTPTALAPFTGQPPAPGGPPEPEVKDDPTQMKPGDPPADDEKVEAKRARVKKAVKPLVDAMDKWTLGTTAALSAELGASIAKGIETLKAIFDKSVRDGYTDANKAAFQKANVLPKSGEFAGYFRRALKAHYSTAVEMAEAEVKAAAKAATSKRATGKTAGGVDNWIESFGENEFDDVYATITKTMRKTFISGLKSGWTTQEFVEQISAKAPALAEAAIERVVRTASTDIFNIGRQAVAEAAGDVVAYRYQAILEPERTCEICMDADGLEIGIHDPDVDRVRPPSHPNCRCTMTFITAGEEWETDTQQLSDFVNALESEYGGNLR